MYNSFGLLFFWRVFLLFFSVDWNSGFWKKHHYERRVDCKKHDRKKQRSVDCAEAIKKTVQAMRYEWWGFFMAGDFALVELTVIIFQVYLTA